MIRRPILLYKSFFVLILISLSGCDRGSPEAMLENYTSRLARVLEVETEVPARSQLNIFPHRRERILPTQAIREGLLDTLRLNRCNLIPLIAERNSSLGKVYKASQKMAYELKFYDALRSCLSRLNASTDPDPELLIQLQDIYKIKQQNLAAEIWNGIYTAEELESNFSIGEPALPVGDDGSTATTLEAMTVLAEIAQLPGREEHWQLPDAIHQIEHYYETLHKNRSGAQLLSSLSLLTQQLNYATLLIQLRLEQKPLCYNGKATPQANILKNVFYKYYAAEVQPYMAQIDKNSQRWFAVNAKIITDLRNSGVRPPASVIRYFDHTIAMNNSTSLWSEYETARNKHTQQWQKVLKQCGMMPSGNR